MKNLIYLLMFFLICACSTDNSITPNFEMSNSATTRGSGCPYHLTEKCPTNCFSKTHTVCLNPKHANIHTTVSFIEYSDCIFESDGHSNGGGQSNNNHSTICTECSKCLACIDVLNNLPYARHLHTCTEACGDPCCSNKGR